MVIERLTNGRDLDAVEATASRQAWKPTSPMRFQCATVERRHVRDLRVLAALHETTIAEVLNAVLEAGISAIKAKANFERTES